MSERIPLVRYRDQTDPIDCPYGDVTRVVTGGEGGIANVHIVRVTEGGLHYHQGYDEVYYLLSGKGSIRLGEEDHALRPGAVVNIPAGVPHSLHADEGAVLEFVIFGVPGMRIDDDRARPRKP